MEVSKTQLKAQISQLLISAHNERKTDLQSSIRLAEEALDLSTKQDLPLQRGRSLAALSLFHMIMGDFELARNMAEEAIDVLTPLKDTKGIADAKYCIAATLYKTDDFHGGLYVLLECLTLYKNLDDHYNQSRVQKSIGTIYEQFGDFHRAMDSYQEAIRSGEILGDPDLQSNAFNPMVGIYIKMGRIDEAKELIDKAIQFKNSTKDIRGLAFALYGRGKYYIHTKEYDLAEKDLTDALEIHERMNEKVGSAMCYNKQGLLYFKMGRLELAKERLIKALIYSNKHSIVMGKYKSNDLLHQVAMQEKNFELAVKYLQQYVVEKERVINSQTAKVIQSYEAVHELDTLKYESIRQQERAEINEQKKIELDSFFYRISHDLKGPITSMMSLAYVAKLEVKEEAAKKYIENFETMANRINGILDSVLTLTKTSYEKVDQEEINFRKIIDDCIGSFQHLENFPKINFDVCVEESISFISDWTLIQTILQSLIENGINYARIDQERPMVKISILEIENQITIVVEDNGVGMEKEIAAHLFTTFHRVDRKIPGTGLGMHILKRAVERLNGEVTVKSEFGKGSAFRVSLPCP